MAMEKWSCHNKSSNYRATTSPPVDATGTTTEREILANELRRDMSASILRRIDSVIRSRLERENY